MTLFVDLDGVLADFEKGYSYLTGRRWGFLSQAEAWSRIHSSDNFFTNLEWMSDGKMLWANLLEHDPTILTGIPYGGWASQQKRDWCANKLGEHVPVIPCKSKDKALFCTEGDILIDDLAEAREKWENAGGIFIHHTSADNTLDILGSIL